MNLESRERSIDARKMPVFRAGDDSRMRPPRFLQPAERVEHDTLAKVQMRTRIHAAMEKLRTRVPDDHFQILQDHLFARKTHAEIAAARGLTQGQVRGRFRRAMVLLRQLLSER